MLTVNRVPTAQGKQAKMTKKNPCQGKQGIWKFCRNTANREKTENFVCSSCRFPDSKGKEYCNTCRHNFNVFLDDGYICQVSLVYVIVTHHINWHRENLRSDRENTGNFKMQFEWGPCIKYIHVYHSGRFHHLVFNVISLCGIQKLLVNILTPNCFNMQSLVCLFLPCVSQNMAHVHNVNNCA